MPSIARDFRNEHVSGTTRATALGFEHGRRSAILVEQPDLRVAEDVWFNEYYGGHTEYRSAYHSGFVLGWDHHNETKAAQSLYLLRALSIAAAGELAASILCRGFYENGFRGSWQGELQELVKLVTDYAKDASETRRAQVSTYILDQVNVHLVEQMTESYQQYIKETADE